MKGWEGSKGLKGDEKYTKNDGSPARVLKSDVINKSEVINKACRGVETGRNKTNQKTG